MLELLVSNFLLLIASMLLLWLLSIALGDVSFVDSFWALGFVLVAVATHFLFLAPGQGQHRMLLLGVTAIWGLRLGIFLFLRWRRDGADPRYVRMLEKAKGNRHLFSLRNVFLLQGVMLWTVCLPLQLGMLADTGLPAANALGFLAWAGVALAILGILFESIGDAQMASFRGNPDNRGQVMDRGLWRYTRHPNYFGDSCVWWGIYCLAISAGAPLWTVLGPVLLTWTLVRWSGAALLERRLRRSRPGYDEYIARTSSFIPWPPRSSS